jgi:F-type H+-transporting ATPase subunit b
VTNPNRRIAYVAALIALSGLLLVAGNAAASEGQLYILPHDEHGNLAFRDLTILIIFFAALMFPLNALIFQPIFRVLDAREEKTSGTRKRADQLASDAEAMLERYDQSVREVRKDAEEARKLALASARDDGSTTTAGARGDAENEVTRAREEIAAALDQARETLKSQAAGLAGEVAERALGRRLS